MAWFTTQPKGSRRGNKRGNTSFIAAGVVVLGFLAWLTNGPDLESLWNHSFSEKVQHTTDRGNSSSYFSNRFSQVSTAGMPSPSQFLPFSNRVMASVKKAGAYFFPKFRLDDDSEANGDLDQAEDETLENQAPVAMAGSDISVDPSSINLAIQLDGRNSYDPDLDPLHFQWHIVGAPKDSQPSLADSDSPVTTVQVSEDGVYRLALRVFDGELWSKPDLVKITVTSKKTQPKAVITGKELSPLGQITLIKGEESSDPENDPLSFSWTLVTKPDSSGSEITDPSETNIALKPDLPGIYILGLTVNDGKQTSAQVRHQLTVGSPLTSLVGLEVDSDQVVTLGNSVTVNAQITGNMSREGDYEILWTSPYVPPNSQIDINSITPQLSFTPDVKGHYLLRAYLRVNRQLGYYKTVRITVNPKDNGTPIAGSEIKKVDPEPHLPAPDYVFAGAGGNKVRCLSGGKIPLQGTAYSTSMVEPLVEWKVIKAPNGSDPGLEFPNQKTAYLVPDKYGDYVVELTATDLALNQTNTQRAVIKVLRDSMKFSLPPYEWPAEIVASSKPHWSGLNVIYGPNRKLSHRKKMPGVHEFSATNLLAGTSHKIEIFDKRKNAVFFAETKKPTVSSMRFWIKPPPGQKEGARAWHAEHLELRVHTRTGVVHNFGKSKAISPTSDFPNEGNQSVFSHDFMVELDDSPIEDEPYYFTYNYFHRYLGAIWDEKDLPRYKYTRRRIHGSSCYEVVKD